MFLQNPDTYELLRFLSFTYYSAGSQALKSLSRAACVRAKERREGILMPPMLANCRICDVEVSPRLTLRARPTITNGYSAGGPCEWVALELKHYNAAERVDSEGSGRSRQAMRSFLVGGAACAQCFSPP